MRTLEENKQWRYFIKLLDGDKINNLVEGYREDEDGIPVCCTYDYAISFVNGEDAIKYAIDKCKLKEDEFILECVYCY